MSLGQNIYTLRTHRGMSQGELADALEVSRQSISKWENDSSVPELDKLLRLSEIFGVTLDELVKGEKPESGHASKSSEILDKLTEWLEKCAGFLWSNWRAVLRIGVGVIFTLAAFYAFVLLAFSGRFSYALILTIPLLICAVICLAAKKHTLFFCICGVLFFASFYASIISDSAWTVVLQPIFYTGVRLRSHLYAGWALFALALLILAYSLWHFRHVSLSLTKKQAVLLALGWLAYLACLATLTLQRLSILQSYLQLTEFYESRALFYTARSALFIFLVSVSLAVLRGRVKKL